MESVLFYLAINVVLGGAACFFGRRLFFVFLGAIVFLGALNLGLGASEGGSASLPVALVLGVVAALLSKFFYRVGVFLVGFVAGAALGAVGAMALMPEGASQYLGVIALVAGLVVGALAVFSSDLAVRLGTAYAGAAFVAGNLLAAALSFGELAARVVPGDFMASFDALSTYVTGEFSAANATAVLVVTVILTVMGFLAQGKACA